MDGDGAFDAWIGRTEGAEDAVPWQTARALAATLDLDAEARVAAGIVPGGLLPPLWHWLTFLPDAPTAALDDDGHPLRGGFLPPVPLERRMWAGGRLAFHGAMRIDAPIRRASRIAAVRETAGRTGRMVFVTVEHRLEAGGRLAVEEVQDIVYMAMPERFAPPAPVPPPQGAAVAWEEAAPMDPARLFRFSAATFNAHRIHYDLAYAREVEKYPGLVVHGPLQAILLMEAARRRRGGALPRAYAFRGLRPLFCDDSVRLLGGPERDGGADLATAAGGDHVCMQARVDWA